MFMELLWVYYFGNNESVIMQCSVLFDQRCKNGRVWVRHYSIRFSDVRFCLHVICSEYNLQVNMARLRDYCPTERSSAKPGEHNCCLHLCAQQRRPAQRKKLRDWDEKSKPACQTKVLERPSDFDSKEIRRCNYHCLHSSSNFNYYQISELQGLDSIAW